MELSCLDMISGFEIDTADAKGVKDFYGPLMGWTFATEPGSGADGSTCIRITAPGAAAPMGLVRQHAAGGREATSLRVFSGDVAADAARLEKLGAAVVAPAAPDGDRSVRARVTDPRGNVLTLVSRTGAQEAEQGAGRPQPGAFASFEIGTTDAEATRAFYAQAFGWRFEPDPGSVSAPYYSIFTGPVPTGGMYDYSAVADGAEFAMPTFLATDVPTNVSRAVSLGGAVEYGPEATTYGLVFARLTDPHGNRFGLFTMPQG
ncbi:VOC family protein [Streptomyces gilvosporeus]|uniref:VOC family protein n=1 Tax=Streptomyces gilvosporeus TaxID=553510 RepID=UPI000D1B8862|nr:VOC family protein [Streptomyces gilvosporeus]